MKLNGKSLVQSVYCKLGGSVPMNASCVSVRPLTAILMSLLAAAGSACANEGIAAITSPSVDVMLSFLAAGRIAEVLVQDGDIVKEGQLLSRQDDTVEQAQLAILRAESEDRTQILAAQACTAGGGHDSGWQTGTSYTDTGLTPDTQYTYTVKARDTSGNYNETAESTALSATTTGAVAYNVYYGMLHSHTNISDGSGTPARVACPLFLYQLL